MEEGEFFFGLNKYKKGNYLCVWLVDKVEGAKSESLTALVPAAEQREEEGEEEAPCSWTTQRSATLPSWSR